MKLDNKDLDKLFKVGSEQFEFEYNEDSWIALKKQLDKRDRSRRIAVFILFIGLILFIFLVLNYRSVDNNVSQSTSNQTVLQDHDDVQLMNQVSSLSDQEKHGLDDSLVDNSNKPIEDKKQLVEVLNIQHNKNQMVQNKTIDKELALMKEEIQSNRKKGTSIHNPVHTNTKQILSSMKTRNIVVDKIPVISIKLERSYYEKITHQIYQTNPQTVSHPTFNMSASIFAAVEGSSDGFGYRPKLGWRFGTLFGFALSSKVDLVAGFALSKKKFASSGSSYSMEGGWPEDIVPMSMSGKCVVGEIPILARYYFTARNQNGFFVEGGLSSYFLNSEWYGFDYTTENERYFLTNNTDPIREVNTDNTNKYLAGVSNIGIGYQKIIGNNTFLSIASYTQLPLHGIGSGKINIYSYGIRLAIKYAK